MTCGTTTDVSCSPTDRDCVPGRSSTPPWTTSGPTCSRTTLGSGRPPLGARRRPGTSAARSPQPRAARAPPAPDPTRRHLLVERPLDHTQGHWRAPPRHRTMPEDRLVLTNLLLERPWMSPAALTLLIVLGPFAGAWLSRRSRLAWLLCAGALVPVALLTLVPVDRELFGRCTLQWALPTPGRVELMANVVLFVAPALLAGVASRRPLVVLVALSGLSGAVEALQALVPGLGRSCDTTDWSSNTIGAGTGAGLAAAALSLARAYQGHRQGGAASERSAAGGSTPSS